MLVLEKPTAVQLCIYEQGVRNVRVARESCELQRFESANRKNGGSHTRQEYFEAPVPLPLAVTVHHVYKGSRHF
jgi:hypothetical protein